jgi:hypothetical protein
MKRGTALDEKVCPLPSDFNSTQNQQIEHCAPLPESLVERFRHPCTFL